MQMNQEIVSSEAVAAFQEQRSRLAVKHVLPPLGAKMVNQYGIEWIVSGHTYMPDLTSLARDKGELVPDHPRDLLPIIAPQNLSPRLSDFLGELDRCTSRILVVMDTIPHLRPQQAHADGHWVEQWADPDAICFLFDAAHIHETIIAHEVAHVWIDLVEDCEDHRLMRDLSDTAKVRQVLYVQSFVLDRKVNQVIEQRGFDMSIVAGHQWDAVSWMAQKVAKGHRPITKREAVFSALTIAATLWEQGDQLKAEAVAAGSLQPQTELRVALDALRQNLPVVYALAEDFAAAVQRHGYNSREQLRRSIDECLRLAFEFTGEDFDIEKELHTVPPTEPDFDKWPSYFIGWPVAAKREIGKLMAQSKIRVGNPVRFRPLPTGQISVSFLDQQGHWTPHLVLQHAPTFLPRHRYNSLGLSPERKLGAPMPRPISNSPKLASPISKQTSVPLAPVSPTTAPIHNFTFEASPLSQGRRSYMPGEGRWLSRDPLGFEGGDANLYRYVSNNPVNEVDPSGLKKPGGAGKGCSAAQLAIIRPAIKRFCDLFNNKTGRTCVWTCLNKYGVTSRMNSFQTWCKNPSYNCTICTDTKGKPDPRPCAQSLETNGPSYTIEYCQGITSSACAAIRNSTTAHESAHGAGKPGESGDIFSANSGFHPTIYKIGNCIANCIEKPCPQPPTPAGILPENGNGNGNVIIQ